MALTKISGDVIQTSVNVGVVTATTINVGSAVTIHTGGFQVGSSSLHSSGVSLNNINATGVVTATSFVGDGINLTNTGSTLSAASGSQRVVLTGLTTGTMTASATSAALTFNASTGALNATSFVGDGSALTGVGGTANVRTDSLVVSGVSTFNSAVVVTGNARITGIVTATNGFNADTVPFFRNTPTISTDYTVTTTYNEMSIGPITINSGVTVTVNSGATWTVV